MNDFLAQLGWYGFVIFFTVSGTYKNKADKYKKELGEKQEALHIIYDEVYAADRLTGFVKRLEAISKQHETPTLRLSDIQTDLKDYVETVERRINGPTPHFDLVALKAPEARDELEQLRTKLISQRKG